jgi:hypothetical protein
LGSYDNAAKEFVRYACKMPNGFRNHPLNETNPKNNSFIKSQRRKNKLVLLGTYWNAGISDKSGSGPANPARHPKGPRGMTRRIEVPEGIPILCCPLLSIISADEFPHRFNKRGPSKEVMDAAKEIIDKAKGSVTIRKNSDTTKKFSIRQMERVSVRDGKKEGIQVSPNVWPAWRRGGPITGCWDGYFLAFKGLEKGSYTLIIETSAKMFDARRADEDRFFSEVTYKIDVI